MLQVDPIEKGGKNENDSVVFLVFFCYLKKIKVLTMKIEGKKNPLQKIKSEDWCPSVLGSEVVLVQLIDFTVLQCLCGTFHHICCAFSQIHVVVNSKPEI